MSKDKQQVKAIYRELVLSGEITVNGFDDSDAVPEYSAAAIDRLVSTIVTLETFDQVGQCENAFFAWGAEMSPKIIGSMVGTHEAANVGLSLVAHMAKWLRDTIIEQIDDYISHVERQEILIQADGYIERLDRYETEMAEADRDFVDMMMGAA